MLKRTLTAVIEPHPGFREVGRRMYALARQFSEDLDVNFSRLPLQLAVEYVADLGYKADSAILPDAEILMRPEIMQGPADCKKMCTLLGAWAHHNSYCFRFVAVAEADQNGDGVADEKDVHHVTIFIYDNEDFYMIDPTRRLDVQQPLYAEIL